MAQAEAPARATRPADGGGPGGVRRAARTASRGGGDGPGQRCPTPRASWEVSDPFDAAANVDGAARLLAGHLARSRRRLRLAIAAYHAGPGVSARARPAERRDRPATSAG